MIDVIQRHNEHKSLQQAAMRTIGNLASIDEKRRWLVWRMNALQLWSTALMTAFVMIWKR